MILSRERNRLRNPFRVACEPAVTAFANNLLILHLESRALSVPAKTMPHIHEGRRSPEERMKEFIGILWNAVKSLTLQVNLNIRIMALHLTILCNFSIFNCSIIFVSTFPWSVLSLVHWCTMFITDSISVLCLVFITLMNFVYCRQYSHTLYHVHWHSLFFAIKIMLKIHIL